MKGIFHRAITEQALRPVFSPVALEAIVQANLGQDALRYQFGSHDHFHYDNSAFSAGDNYLREQHQLVLDALQTDQAASLAHSAFGRLTHTAQDFYAHSNYVSLWREQNPGSGPQAIDPLQPELLHDPRLCSGQIYAPLEYLSFFPALKPLVLPRLPRDSHAWMNKDDPSRPDFDYAYAAAVQRTALELETLRRELAPLHFPRFTGQT